MRGLLWVIGLWISGSLAAQERFVVPGGAGTKDGSSWANAMASIASALTEGTEVKVGRGVYELDAELVIPQGKTVNGGWNPETGERLENFAAQTVLRPKTGALHRVATVGGTLEGVTVENGVVIQGKGGGVYIQSTGVVRNCIIRNNMASQYYPKVGDAYCSDGTFLSKEEITAENVGRIEGIVFWVNPDPNAETGTRGWIAKWDYDVYEVWANVSGSENSTEKVYNTAGEALADTAGFAVTQTLRANTNAGDYAAVTACGEGWYLPAMGQLRCLYSELFWVEETIKVIYTSKGVNPLTFWVSLGDNVWSATEGMQGNEYYVWVIDGEGGCQLMAKDNQNMVIPVKSF